MGLGLALVHYKKLLWILEFGIVQGRGLVQIRLLGNIVRLYGLIDCSVTLRVLGPALAHKQINSIPARCGFRIFHGSSREKSIPTLHSWVSLRGQIDNMHWTSLPFHISHNMFSHDAPGFQPSMRLFVSCQIRVNTSLNN